MPQVKVPGVGLLDGIFGFITKFIFGIVIMKLIDLLPKLKGLLGALKGAGKVFNFLINGVGFILDTVAILYKILISPTSTATTSTAHPTSTTTNWCCVITYIISSLRWC